MRQAGEEVVRQLAPQCIMPAELGSPRDWMRLQQIDVRPRRFHRFHAVHHIAGHVVRHTRPHAERANALHELGDFQGSIGAGGMRVAIHRLPFAHGILNGSGTVRAVSRAGGCDGFWPGNSGTIAPLSGVKIENGECTSHSRIGCVPSMKYS